MTFSTDPGWVKKALEAEATKSVRSQGVASCNPSPCLDGGTCVTQGGNHSCACAPGFTGVFCQVSLMYLDINNKNIH